MISARCCAVVFRDGPGGPFRLVTGQPSSGGMIRRRLALFLLPVDDVVEPLTDVVSVRVAGRVDADREDGVALSGALHAAVGDVILFGIRAHDFIPAAPGKSAPNLFRAGEADRQEGPFEVSVRMMVNGNPPEAEERYVWWKTETTAWEQEYGKKCPEAFWVKPEKVMALR